MPVPSLLPAQAWAICFLGAGGEGAWQSAPLLWMPQPGVWTHYLAQKGPRGWWNVQEVSVGTFPSPSGVLPSCSAHDSELHTALSFIGCPRLGEPSLMVQMRN
jgi:hypothetical protein